MLFFRVILCVVGLLLYLVIKQFSDRPVASQNALQQLPATPVVDATQPFAPLNSANAGTFQPVAAKPAPIP